MAEAEEWRDVPGYEGIYQVSSLGRVIRRPRFVLTKNGCFRLHNGGIVGGKNTRGYIEVRLSREGKVRTRNVHALVCAAFHGPKPGPEYHAAHNDGSRDNNLPSNLRWATPKSNAEDRAIHGTQTRGEEAFAAKLTRDDIVAIRASHRGHYGEGVRLARQYGVSGAQISHIVKNQHWRHVA